jgi:hypothetical protein
VKIFLSAVEGSEKHIIDRCIREGINLKYILISYFHLRKNEKIFNKLRLICDEMLIDSGAHSFQKGFKVDFYEFTKEYAQWIIENDCDQMTGYFEMDIDNLIGYDEVKKLRAILEAAHPTKIIPVWHATRGVEEFEKMCEEYAGRIVAISAIRNKDISDDQYMMFLKTAKKYGCKVHALGMTRTNLLNKVPFDYTDSSTWKQTGNYGGFAKFTGCKMKVVSAAGGLKTYYLDFHNLKEFMKMQQYFEAKYKHLE